jgi:hypothetical protein
MVPEIAGMLESLIFCGLTFDQFLRLFQVTFSIAYKAVVVLFTVLDRESAEEGK